MNAIRLPAGTLFVRFDELAKLLACALHPEPGDDADNYDAAFAQIEYEDGALRRAVEAGELVVKNPLTRLPLAYIAGHALNRGVVMIDDLRAFAAGLGLSVTVGATEQGAPAQRPAEPAPVATESACNMPGNGKKWTPEKKSELQAYRENHTMPETAAKFGISEQRIRQLLPRANPKNASPFPGVIYRTR